MFVSVVHGSQEKRTTTTKAWDNDGKFEFRNAPLELWDGESGETIEFFVSSCRILMQKESPYGLNPVPSFAHIHRLL